MIIKALFDETPNISCHRISRIAKPPNNELRLQTVQPPLTHELSCQRIKCSLEASPENGVKMSEKELKNELKSVVNSAWRTGMQNTQYRSARVNFSKNLVPDRYAKNSIPVRALSFGPQSTVFVLAITFRSELRLRRSLCPRKGQGEKPNTIVLNAAINIFINWYDDYGSRLRDMEDAIIVRTYLFLLPLVGDVGAGSGWEVVGRGGKGRGLVVAGYGVKLGLGFKLNWDEEEEEEEEDKEGGTKDTSTSSEFLHLHASLLCIFSKELANSLDAHTRQHIPTFMDAVEEILVQQMHAEMQADNSDK
ncbi:hypothetical protein LguiA_002087 [Lonicera macranthoides]